MKENYLRIVHENNLSILSGRAGAEQQLATSYLWFAIFTLLHFLNPIWKPRKALLASVTAPHLKNRLNLNYYFVKHFRIFEVS